MKKYILLIISLFWGYKFFAQHRDLVLDFQLADLPYQILSARTVSRTYPNFAPKYYHYFYAYSNPSMYQSLSIANSFSNGILLGLTRMNYEITGNNFVNSLYRAMVYSIGFYVLEYNPLGLAWLHEEFHRAVLTKHFVNSFNEANRFKYFAKIIRVYNVSDSDLVKFKSSFPQDFVRLHEAGIEGENMFVFSTYKNNFFYDQQLPYAFISSTSLLNSFFYIYSCQRPEAEQTTIEENAKDGANVSIRDFTGLDFTAWVYDLNRPFEPYQLRGVHPSGVGIDRYIKPSDLTPSELKYLRKEAFWHLLNVVSPFFWGINKIPINNIQVNFSFRHLLTSFGDDISFYLFYKQEEFNLLFAFHTYRNKYLVLPGVETEILSYPIKLYSATLYNTFSTNLWIEPKNLLYYDAEYFLGGSLGYRIEYCRNILCPYFEVRAKSFGWEAGNVFQEQNISYKFGLSLVFDFSTDE